MRLIWAILGFVSLGAGIVGAVLPLIPTVPFVLLAAFCFSKSSERMHNWLLSHPRFGPAILNWQENGAVSLSAKRAASLACGAVLLISLALRLPWHLIAIQAATLSCVMIFLWTRPSGPR